MTNTEAAEIMKAIIFILKNDDYSDEVEEAIHMAISSLQAQEKAQEVSNNSPELDNNFGDLISRAAATNHLRHIIDATDTDSGYNEGFTDGLEFCISHMSTMPSAQPETHEKKHRNACVRLYQQESGVECLEHLSACDEPFVEIGTGDETFIGKYEAITEISDLPSAQPTQCNSGNILRHPQCANRTNLGNCDPVGGFCNSVPKEICDAQPQPEPQSRMVFGYSMEYLVAFAEACRRANVDESDLKTFANNCTFAYATMAEEYRQQINQAIDAFMGNARGTNESD